MRNAVETHTVLYDDAPRHKHLKSQGELLGHVGVTIFCDLISLGLVKRVAAPECYYLSQKSPMMRCLVAASFTTSVMSSVVGGVVGGFDVRARLDAQFRHH